MRQPMPFEIPNYDSLVGRAARPIAEDAIPATVREADVPTAREPVVAHDGWDPNAVELDLDELETRLSRR